MLQATFAPLLPSRLSDRAPQTAVPPAAGLPRAIALHRPLWRRIVASLRQWWIVQRDSALARQRCRELARLDAATLRDLGLGICAGREPLPDWAFYERARW